MGKAASKEAVTASDPGFSGLATIYSSNDTGEAMNHAVIAYDHHEKSYQLLWGRNEDDWAVGGNHEDFDNVQAAVQVAKDQGYTFDTTDVEELKAVAASKGESTDDVPTPDDNGTLKVPAGAADITTDPKPTLQVKAGGADITEAADDVDRMQAILQLGDYIALGMDGSETTKDRLATTLNLRGHVGLSFDDPYAALNVLSDEDLTEVYNFALQNGMPSLAISAPTTEPTADVPEVKS